MKLLDRFKKAYKKMDIIPDQLDCHQPLLVLYYAEKENKPSPSQLTQWIEEVLGKTKEGFFVGFCCNIPFPPSNAKDFVEGFYLGKDLIQSLL
jgi:hypothetical protein